MTRKQFEAMAIRKAEYEAGAPDGWWGKWRDVTNGVVRVRFSGAVWIVSVRGKRVSSHDSRAGAIAKARKL